ncbi:hypothetical protein [Sporichthya sp.]|uniref:hypothetical protein n=1 Tax=Sporichthya sp. TaxID=65475 RepID=UPI001838D5BA|nr:hypothetical protein [Sporichthya sp.]MBA3744498.1 hypothetical protein [Sporichthya sp.]
MSDVKPYFVPPSALIAVSEWSGLVGGEWEAIGDRVEDWDYRTRLQLRCTIDADLDAVRSAARLADAPLIWAIGWRATDTGLVGEPTQLAAVSGPITVDLEVPPERAGSTIILTRRLLLAADRGDAVPGQARWAGSILWSDETTLRLTGHGAAFPAEVVDFRATGHDPDASWYLELPATPDVPVMGAMILLINASDTALVSAVSVGRRANDVQQVLLATMEEGIVEELVRWALHRWRDLEDVEGDSVGASARTLALRVLPDVESWTVPEADSMALKSAIVDGCRRIGFGRRLA